MLKFQMERDFILEEGQWIPNKLQTWIFQTTKG